MVELCGCGKPVRYSGRNGEGSCNKYGRCPTYDELSKQVDILSRRLKMYQDAVNKVDDYFEYQAESKKDQKKVYQILGNLTDKLSNTISK